MNFFKSRWKILLAIFSLIITLFIWQQGLRDSLRRPSVVSELTIRQEEIQVLAYPNLPDPVKNIVFTKDPLIGLQDSLKSIEFEKLSERNKLLLAIIEPKEEYLSSLKNISFEDSFLNQLKNKINFNDFSKSSLTYSDINDFKKDSLLYKIISEKIFNNKTSIYTDHNNILIRFYLTQFLPIAFLLFGSILIIYQFWISLFNKKLLWIIKSDIQLDLVDLILLIAGGFVVLGELFSPLIILPLTSKFDLFFRSSISQSLKIFIGYISMALPALLILCKQIQSHSKSSFLDSIQFKFKPLLSNLIIGIKGWLMVIPPVFLVSALMNYFIKEQAGSNPLLEIVLNSNDFIAIILLLITTMFLAPLFEEIIFRGALLPVVGEKFGVYIGILITAFTFALAHLSLGEFPPLFVLGIGLCIVRLSSGNLFPSIVMHSVWNGITFMNLLLLTK
tara:strand:- start:8537 stop:9877 length:1341 start_codon:yes stop_codon:yes gene_type:complete